MKRVLKSILALALCAAMVLGTVCFEGIDFSSLRASAAVEYSSNTVDFGSYPQRLVTEDDLLSQLNAKSKNWKYFDYYSGNGSYGSMSSGKYMMYADVYLGEYKYRAITFTQYRPNTSCGVSDAANTYQDRNGYHPGEIYWFSYAPIEWYIVDAGLGILMSTSILDAQPYSNFIYWADSDADGIKDKNEVFNNSSCTTYANDYASSAIREWLNDDFYNTAFSSEEKKELKTVTLNNETYLEANSEYSSKETQDKVFLLSHFEVSSDGYGLESGFWTKAMGTSYAKCQGLFSGDTNKIDGYSHWWLRTAGSTSYTAANVHATHLVHSDGVSVNNTYIGVRPAIKVDLICTIPSALPSSGKIKIASANSWSDGCNYNYYYTDDFFKGSSSEYNHSLALMSLVLACSAYVPNGGWKERAEHLWVESGDDYRYKYAANAALLFDEIGFDLVKSKIKTEFGTVERSGCFYGYNQKPEFHTIACSIGAKNIEETDTTIIACAVRGSGYEAEWGGNFVIGSGSVNHDGFNRARNQVLTRLNDFVIQNGESFKSNVKIWITGYSRAAATSNLTAAVLNNGASGYSALASLGLSKEKVFCYGFETPQGTTNFNAPSSSYNNIFSIVNPIDLVPFLAPSTPGFNFKRFGITYYLPCKELTSQYESHYLNEYKSVFSSLYAKTYSEDFVAYDIVQVDLSLEDGDGFGINFFEQNTQKGQLETLVELIKLLSQKVLKNRSNYVQNYQNVLRSVMATFMGGYDGLLGDLASVLVDSFKGKNVINEAKSFLNKVASTRNDWPKNWPEKIFTIIKELFVGSGPLLLTTVKNFINKTNGVFTLFYPHSTEVTLSWMVYLDGLSGAERNSLFSSNKAKYRNYVVNCPVDIFVYDNSNTLIGSIINDEVSELDGISIYIDTNGQKCFSLPFDSEYKIKIVATDSGEVNCSIKELDIETLKYERIINHYDISVKKGDVIEGIAECSDGSTECLYPLTLNGNEALVPDEELTDEDIVDYSVTVSNNLDIAGLTSGGGVMTKGEFAQATAYECEGIEFLGWYIGDTLISTDLQYRFAVDGDIEIVGKFDLTEYKADFISEGNLVESIPYTVLTESIEEPEIPSKEGHSGVWEEYTLSVGGVSVNAVYTANTYTVTWVNDGIQTEESYLYGENINAPEIPSKAYYIPGWSPQVPETMPAENLTFTATWTPITCEAVFDADGGKWQDSETTKTVPVDYDSQIAAPDAPEKQGYIFAGWLLDGENIGTDAGIMDNPDGKLFTAAWIASDETYYTVETYTMTPYGEYVKSAKLLQGTTDENVSLSPEVGTGYVLNEEESVLSGNVSADNSLVLKVYIDRQAFTFTTVVDDVSSSLDYYFGAMVAQPKTPLKTGYNFTGWSGEIPATMPAKNIELTAEFELVEYKAVFVADGNEVACVPYTVESKAVEIPDVPQKQGHSAAWEDFAFEAGGIRVNAIYTPNTYKITWKADFVTVETEVKYGQEIIAPDIPEKAGYVFTGWDKSIPDTMPAEDLVFTAIYEKTGSDKFICPNCGNEFDSEEALNAHVAQENRPSDISLTIKTPSVERINYGETLIMHANVSNLPEGAKLVWEASGSGVEIEPAKDGKTCNVISVSSGEAIITVKAVDTNGNVIKNSDSTEVSYSQKITSKAGLWQKIVSFFKNLFRIGRVIPQTFFK